MFKFEKPQEIYEIGGVNIGGQPGELPATLIGSIFYQGHGIVEDPRRGVFDRARAEELIARQDELSDQTGNPCMLDVVCTSAEASRSYIGFVSEATDAPILLDAYPRVRLEALEYVSEAGLTDRIVYNSIYDPTEDEVTAVRDSGVEAGILLAYNPEEPTARGVLSNLKGTEDKPGLLEVSERAGITKPLVDAPLFTYIPSIGEGAMACFRVKEELGLPAGGATGNAAASWEQPEDWESDVAKINYVAPQVVPLALGADFLLYGAIDTAPLIFPACAAVDAMVASTAWLEHGTEILTREHPLYRLFPEFVGEIEKALRD